MDAMQWPHHNGGHHQHHDRHRLAWAHLRFAKSLATWDTTWSIQLRNASTTTSTLTSRWWISSTSTSDWEANQQEGCNTTSCINSGHLQPQNNRGCLTQRFSATFFRGNQHESIISIHIDIDIDIQEEDINIECSEFFDNSFWMEISTYNRDDLENNFEHNMVHQAYNVFVGNRLGIAQQPSSTMSSTRSTRESGSTMTFEFSSSSTSRSLRPSTPHLVISLFTPSSSEGGDNDKMDSNNDKMHNISAQQPQ